MENIAVLSNFEVVPEGKRIIPIEECWARKKGSRRLGRRIERILGESTTRICVQYGLYANPGKRFHWDVLALDREDLDNILKANWGKLISVMELFGKALTGYRVTYPKEVQ